MLCRSCGRNPEEEPIGPTLEAVEAEISAMGYSTISASKFVDFYDRNGWRRKDGSPVTDWKGQLRAWDIRDKQQKSA